MCHSYSKLKMEVFFHDDLLRQVYQIIVPFLMNSEHDSNEKRVNHTPKRKLNSSLSIQKEPKKKR